VKLLIIFEANSKLPAMQPKSESGSYSYTP